MHVAVYVRSTTEPSLLLLANAGLLSRSSRPTHLWSQNPVQILMPTNPSEGSWVNPDLVVKWSHSPAKTLPFLTQDQPNPAKALPFLPQAQTNTILILNPSSNPLYFRSLNFPNIFTCAKSNQTNTLPTLFVFYDAFSDHACVFLCVSMYLETELSTPRETPTQRTMATQYWMSSTHSHLHSGPAPTYTPLHGSEV